MAYGRPGRQRAVYSYQEVGLANRPKVAVDIIGEKTPLTNRLADDQPTENAATSAKVNGVKTIETVENSQSKRTPKRGRSAMSLYGKDAHKRVAKCIGYALTQGTTTAWNKMLIILVARLSEKERVQLAWAALSACPDDHAYKIASSILYPSYGEGAA